MRAFHQDYVFYQIIGILIGVIVYYLLDFIKGPKRKIRKHLSYYKKLSDENEAKCPCAIAWFCLGTNISELCSITEESTYIYMHEESFVIISSLDEFSPIVIHFEDIVGQKCRKWTGEYYIISLQIALNDEFKYLSFMTVQYNIRNFKKYIELLNYPKLYTFINEKFPLNEKLLT